MVPYYARGMVVWGLLFMLCNSLTVNYITVTLVRVAMTAFTNIYWLSLHSNLHPSIRRIFVQNWGAVFGTTEFCVSQ